KTAGDEDTPRDKVMELSGGCAEVDGETFRVIANGKSCEVSIRFEPARGKYKLTSDDLDARYYSSDSQQSESITRYLNRTQSFRVIPSSAGFFYTLGRFCKPLIQFGPDYDDTKYGILA